ncbi:cytokine-like protein 1 isoform X2 [Pongo pygmaeus]|uniref:cytokine-like protein 1 isoform X2 n=1 Tax=Pongo pygmaeus TaxID=9600 RepID=UPI00300D6A9A
MRTPGPLPVLLLLLAGIPAARPTPPTCYSRMRALSQEITRDFQLLQVSEPSEPCVRYLPRLYLDIHPPPHCPLPELLCAGQAAGLCGLAPMLESGPGGFLEGQSTEAVHHHELILQERFGIPVG